MLRVIADREPAEHGVAELVPPQLPRRRHHPAHAEGRAEPLGVAGAGQPGPDHFLQRDDVRVDRGEHRGDALGAHAPVEAAAAVDVVGRDAQVDVIARRRRHPGIIVCRSNEKGGARWASCEPSTKSRARAVSRRS